MPAPKRKRRSSTVGLPRKAAGKGRNASVRVPRTKLALPQSMRTKLRYVEQVEFKPTGQNAIQSSYRANGLFDPSIALGGHQPRGFDEFMAICSTFTVVGSTCSVNFMYEGYDGPSQSGGVPSGLISSTGYDGSNVVPALSPVIVGIHKGVDVLAAGSAPEQMEKDRTQWKVMTPSGGPVTMSSSLMTKDFFGKKFLPGKGKKRAPCHDHYTEAAFSRFIPPSPHRCCSDSVHPWAPALAALRRHGAVVTCSAPWWAKDCKV
jgi:hypothetical protein